MFACVYIPVYIPAYSYSKCCFRLQPTVVVVVIVVAAAAVCNVALAQRHFGKQAAS